MILINPRGKEVEKDDKKAKKILKNPLKIKQGWKKKVVKPKAKNKANGQSNNKK